MGEKQPAETILQDSPTPEEIRREREKWGLSQGQFGALVAQFADGGPRYRYTRQAISAYERGTLAIGRPFARAFRRLQGQCPAGVRFLEGVQALENIPPGTVIAVGVLVRCAVCGRLLLAWPTTKYCPPELGECRRIGGQMRRRERQAAKLEAWLKKQEQTHGDL